MTAWLDRPAASLSALHLGLARAPDRNGGFAPAFSIWQAKDAKGRR